MTGASPPCVHLRQNRLAEKFARIRTGEHFVIAETDFADGLGFLSTWQLWRESSPPPFTCLHFISMEHQPRARDGLAQALAERPGLSILADELIASYPPAITGPHRVILDEGRVRLTLYIGDVFRALTDMNFKADAWFLDDFPPARNPVRWDQPTIKSIALHSRPGTSFSAFTRADNPGLSLAEEGFEVHQVENPDQEKKLLVGEIATPGFHKTDLATTPPKVAIVGAGIAGTLLAANLAGRGLDVTLIDQGDTTGSGASGNRQGALYVKLGVDYNDQTQLALSSLLFSQRFYQRFTDNGWHPTGLIQLAYNDAEADRQARFLARNSFPISVLTPVNSEQASRIAGIPIPHSGLWFPGSGWLQPGKLCKKLADGPGIAHRFSFRVATLEADGSRWKLNSSDGETLTVDRVVLCAGAETPELIPLSGEYRMKKIRGQITEVAEEHLNPPALVICGPGYVNPSHEGRALVGATFDLHDPSPKISAESALENLGMLAGLLPDALAPSDVAAAASGASGRVAFRCTTHDYQPVAGQMMTRTGDLLEGLYLFTGLGSKGLTYSPLLAEYLGDLISDQPLCLPGNLLKRVATQRCHRPRVS